MGRAIAKALTWRVVATTVTLGLLWAVTGDVKLSGSVALMDAALKTCAYVWHERAWTSNKGWD